MEWKHRHTLNYSHNHQELETEAIASGFLCGGYWELDIHLLFNPLKYSSTFSFTTSKCDAYKLKKNRARTIPQPANLTDRSEHFQKSYTENLTNRSLSHDIYYLY